jgi:hypothetical protein
MEHLTKQTIQKNLSFDEKRYEIDQKLSALTREIEQFAIEHNTILNINIKL